MADPSPDPYGVIAGRARWEEIGAKPLAQRGQGRVWAVRDQLDPDRLPAALKEMRYRKGPQSTAYRRFLREIETTTRLSQEHAGVVEVIDHGIPEASDEWMPFFVMPLAESSLEKARDLEGKLESVLEIAISVADTLAAAHARGVIHRDIKPGNILLFGDERRPRVCDFGICFLAEDDRLTGVDAETVGSKDFVAPELLGGGTVEIETVGPSADIYSLGKTIYAAVAGGRIFPREDHDTPRWNLALRFNDPRFRHLHGLLGRMVTEHPADRFATMEECKAALQRAYENIRSGVRYVPGIYGGRSAPVEKFLRLSAGLGSTSGYQRADLLHDALEEAFASARSIVSATARPGHDPEYDRAVERQDAAVAAIVGEHLAVPGLALVLTPGPGALEDWIGQIRQHVCAESHAPTRQEILTGHAGVLSLYAAAALAWRRRRWTELNQVLDAMLSCLGSVVYLSLLDGNSRQTAQWVTEHLGTSHLLRQVDPWIGQNAETMVGLISGLYLLKVLEGQSEQKLTELAGPGGASMLDDLAAIQPDYRSWIPYLAELSQSPAAERAVAAAVFEREPNQWRARLRELTPVLYALLRRRGYRVYDQDVNWQFDIDPHGRWKAWIEEK